MGGYRLRPGRADGGDVTHPQRLDPGRGVVPSGRGEGGDVTSSHLAARQRRMPDTSVILTDQGLVAGLNLTGLICGSLNFPSERWMRRRRTVSQDCGLLGLTCRRVMLGNSGLTSRDAPSEMSTRALSRERGSEREGLHIYRSVRATSQPRSTDADEKW